jgi:hypothetical protein
MEPDYSVAPQAEVGGAPCPGLLLKSVFSLYRDQFGHWFGITAPTSLLAAAVLLISDQQVKAISRNIRPFEFQFHWGAFAGAIGFRFGGYFVSWLLGCFALGAIATTVSGLDRDDDDAVWKHDSHQRVREHLGALALVGLCTFCALLVGMAMMSLVEAAAIRVVGWAHFSPFNVTAGLVGAIVVASIVSWLGAAIPLVLTGNTGAWAALKKSVELSSGYEGALFLLVVELMVGSYIGWYAVHYGFRFLLPDSLRYTAWYGWLVYVVAILASAAVEPPIFIGFSLLAHPERISALSSSLPGSQQTPDIQ